MLSLKLAEVAVVAPGILVLPWLEEVACGTVPFKEAVVWPSALCACVTGPSIPGVFGDVLICHCWNIKKVITKRDIINSVRRESIVTSSLVFCSANAR